MTTSTKQGFAHTLRLGMGAVVFAVVLPFLSACSDSQDSARKTQLDTQVDASLMQTLQHVSTDSLRDVILPDQVALQSIPGSPVDNDSTPTVFYMGADYCPYCAAIRWPLALAMMRFGEFSGLKYMRSSSDDVYPDTVTFSFHGADYTSDYVKLAAVEIQDRERNPLEKPNARQIEIFKEFNMKPYVRYPGAIPFLYLDGAYMQSGSPFDPGILKKMSWAEVADALKKSESPVRQTVLGVTNMYTAAICQLTDNKPAEVCNSDAVTAAAARLPD